MVNQEINILIGFVIGGILTLVVKYLIDDIRISGLVREDLKKWIKEIQDQRANARRDIVETPDANAGLNEPSVPQDGGFDPVEFTHTFVNEEKKMVITVPSKDLADRIQTVNDMIDLHINL